MTDSRPSVPSAAELLRRYAFRPKKSLGQHFLVDDRILERIVAAADLSGREAVLEIGPGLGALTLRLGQAAWRVLAVEKDRSLQPVLSEVLRDFGNVQVCWGDVLEVDLPRMCEEAFGPRTVRVVANLPYYVTTPVMMKLLEEGPVMDRMVLMVQREVADRLTARPGTKTYGALTVAVQWFAEKVESVARVPASCFWPRPEVDSVVVRLDLRPRPDPEVTRRLSRVVRAGFGQRRKTLLNALSHALAGRDRASIEQVLRDAGVAPDRRAETLSLEEFTRLAQALADGVYPKSMP
ncbi:MAG: 16S rRNA (adenine(1518)-N(6)/adenine(1519)-N(6))-dimethyltransferase RsmA [Kyrpidia tusciae]|nr:16S rRNA (adenine(1518)-N(6)/adenine(1519)-N(6))-dimethyltransferase RsmA [Kyrpidia tusciae]MBE3552171.1 16S rRNA (adenine(1518)-N(6)/adenine(1519)-N(6))-dimethyltransferase RsmA [Kyrpidia tusciae]